MVGHLAKRAQFGLILPSTNTSVEAEFNRMLVPGDEIYSNHQLCH
jgi:maleate isomerase